MLIVGVLGGRVKESIVLFGRVDAIVGLLTLSSMTERFPSSLKERRVAEVRAVGRAAINSLKVCLH